MSDLVAPVRMLRWDTGTLAWVSWDGSLTTGALVIGAVTQSGTWVVQPGNTANTTAWKVDGSAVTQPVSGTFWQATQPVSLATVPALVAGTANIGDVDVLTLPALSTGTNSIGQVTANAGTNLNTSALSLEATQAALLSRADTFKTRADTFTATGNGTTVDASASPMSAFAVQVQATGVVTSWDVRLEGSLNNTTFTTILTHTNVTGDGVTLWTGTLEAPALYFRSRAAGLVLGGGTNIVVTILGQN